MNATLYSDGDGDEALSQLDGAYDSPTEDLQQFDGGFDDCASTSRQKRQITLTGRLVAPVEKRKSKRGGANRGRAANRSRASGSRRVDILPIAVDQSDATSIMRSPVANLTPVILPPSRESVDARRRAETRVESLASKYARLDTCVCVRDIVRQPNR